MKETGLMFKAPLVRAILDGSKTQTRRLVKWKGLQPGLNLGFSGLGVAREGSGWVLVSNSRTSSEWRCHPTPSPVGQPGDRIYVRETFAHGTHALCAMRDEDGPFVYAADGEIERQGRLGNKWKPSIHMPKHAARTWLEITAVRVERLRSITDADALAEGVDRTNTSISGYARERFKALWESTGGDWNANPWVWVIDFKQIPLPREQSS